MILHKIFQKYAKIPLIKTSTGLVMLINPDVSQSLLSELCILLICKRDRKVKTKRISYTVNLQLPTQQLYLLVLSLQFNILYTLMLWREIWQNCITAQIPFYSPPVSVVLIKKKNDLDIDLYALPSQIVVAIRLYNHFVV